MFIVSAILVSFAHQEEFKQVQIWDCDSTNGNQKFLANAVTSPTSYVNPHLHGVQFDLVILIHPRFTIASKLAPSLCIAASANAGNASVVVANCDATSAAQKWSDPKNNGQMIIYDNLCVTPATGPLVSPSNGVKLVLQTCVANAEPQGWGHRTGQIINFNIKGEVNTLKFCVEIILVWTEFDDC